MDNANEVDIHSEAPASKQVEDVLTFPADSNSPTTLGGTSSHEELHQRLGFFSFISAVFKASIYRKFPSQNVDLPWTYIFYLVIFAVLLQLTGDLTEVGSRGQIALYGMPGLVFFIPVSILSAILVLARTQQRRQLALLTLMYCGLYLAHQFLYLIAIEIYRISLLRPYLPDWRPSFDLGMAIWFGLAAGVATTRIVSLDKRLHQCMVVLFVGTLLCIPLTGMYRNSSLWIRDYQAEQDGDKGAAVNDYDILNQETIIYKQPRILQQQLERIQAPTDADAQMFFVGVAGYASQNVFMNEVKFVERLLQERFKTAKHGISLINNSATVNETSIASVTALQAALEQIGKLMRPDRDVLFLYLSSHGSKSHEFSLEFGGMQFKQLNPQVLKTMLDQAEIKHRVIVISACYSGGYIEPLKNPNSLIITSAAADKTSFGCSNDADYTYFGKAFFVDALSEDISFVDAFAMAKPAIDAREKKEAYDPSNPQIFVGEEIQTTLSKIKKSKTDSGSIAEQGDSPARELPFADARDKQKRQMLAQRLIDSFGVESQLNALLRLCREEQALNSAEKIFKDNSSYFGGITPASHLWPRVVSAVNEYHRQACLNLDDQQFTAVLTSDFAQAHSVKDLEKLLKFYQSDLGKQFVNTNNSAYLTANKKSSRIASENNARANEVFRKEIGRLISEFNVQK
ncbi:C13 family peptidase [Undibacterium flavidum]|uniref:Caspase domain-containing protein n=1 Tax=Undibacterium flavidum TaxID=2762297 RepID=A0ABR6YDS9_9BURK|nr:C13 family peptidase [Undibacterium flavidum]MBC3874710.1 hypothetical protein [Undibacterium flavidum]